MALACNWERTTFSVECQMSATAPWAYRGQDLWFVRALLAGWCSGRPDARLATGGVLTLGVGFRGGRAAAASESEIRQPLVLRSE